MPCTFTLSSVHPLKPRNRDCFCVVRHLRKELMNNKEISKLQDWDKKYIWHPFTQMKDYEQEKPLVIESGEGVYLYDIEGNKYIDGISSLWTNVHGHRVEKIDKAIKDQLDKVAHSTLLGLANVPSIELAKKLIDIVPKGLCKVFYSDDGSTSVEIAIKMAYQYFQQNPNNVIASKAKQSKTKIAHVVNSYHGDTIGSVSVGGIDLFHKVYKKMLFDTVEVFFT